MADKKLNIIVKMKGAKTSKNQMEKLGKSIKTTTGKLGSMAGLLKGAIATSFLYAGLKASKLAAEAEGVERAFRRLNKPGLLDELQKATKGTASNLELMKAAVQANNFRIPLETMGTLLKFAQQRARDTGESVEYLTNSIVMGIGRKSPLILDNLGLSIIEVREEFKKTGDMAKAVANIANKELGKVGETAKTTADEYESMSASLTNMSIAFGNFLNSSGIVKELAEHMNFLAFLMKKMTTETETYNSKQKKGFEESLAMNIKLLKNAKETLKMYEMIGADDSIEKTKKGIARFEKIIHTLNIRLGNNKSAVKDTASEYQIWAMTQDLAAAETEKLAGWQERYNIANGIGAMIIGEQLKPALESIVAVQAKLSEFGEADLLPEVQADTWANDIAVSIETRMEMLSGITQQLIGSAFTAAFTDGESAMEAFGNAFKRILTQLAVKAATFQILSMLFPGAGMVGGFSKFMFGFADGGRPPVNQPSIVGERGPEIFVPDSAGTIIPNAGGNVNINFNGSITDRNYVETYVLPAIRKSMRLGR